MKAARAAIGASEEVGAEALKLAMRALDKAATKGSLHPKNAARRIARLSKQMAAANKQQAAA